MRKISSLGFLLSGLQLSQAINVYLYPPQPFLRSTLSPDDASSALSRHLGLESFEPLRDASTATYSEENFVGQGSSNALLLTLEELDAKAVLPDSLKPSFKLSIPPSSSISSLTSVITTYLHRAKHSYNSVYDSYPHFTEIHDLQSFFDKAHSSAFAALELHDLAEIRSKYGPESENYILAADMTRAFLQHALSQSEDGTLQIAVLTYSPFTSISYSKREFSPRASQAPFPPPQEPIGSVSTCFTTEDACINGTTSCSGRGQCVGATKAGRTCYICACGKTTTGQGNGIKTEIWVGESCERKDVSGPFVLLTGTAVTLILLVVGSVSLLYGVGTVELPSTLMGGAINAKKD